MVICKKRPEQEDTMSNIYNQHLEKNRANYEPLSPLSFIRRTATLFPDWPANVHGDMQRSWSEI
jgi:fatty-acyl-CoA synthase